MEVPRPDPLEAGKAGQAVVPGRLVAGVDEAGLGPLVGPLTIGYSVFRLPSPELCPWRALRRSVTADPAKCGPHGRRLAVADSKKVFARNPKGRRRLEATALAFLSLLREDGAPPTSARALLEGPLAPDPALVARHPWYALLGELPVHQERAALELTAERLRRDLQRVGIAFLEAGVRVVPAAELNASYAETDNKALSVWLKTLAVLRHLWEAHAHEHPWVTVDILGGRLHYGPHLARGFPDASVSLIGERSGHAAYRLEARGPSGSSGPGRAMRLDFRAKGEEHSFPVALASCLAKYARELVMDAFNAYFRALDPALAPTAGYRSDGQRWMREAREALARAALEPAVLVRQR